MVSQSYIKGVSGPEIYWETPEWKQMVQARMPLIRGEWPPFANFQPAVKRVLAGGYDGLCTYESNDTVLETEYVRLFRALRKPAQD